MWPGLEQNLSFLFLLLLRTLHLYRVKECGVRVGEWEGVREWEGGECECERVGGWESERVGGGRVRVWEGEGVREWEGGGVREWEGEGVREWEGGG